MENEIRTYNGKKQVKKGNSWRPCCDVEGCINRADKDICDYHKRVYPVLEKLDEKSKEDKVKDILKLKEIEINNLYDYKEKNLSKKTDICSFICNCGEQYQKTINTILNISGFYCKKCTTKNKFQKIRDTNLKIYGVEYASQSPEIKEKIKKTNLDNYGVEYTFQSEKIKQKIRETNLKIYGVEHASQSKEIRQKQKDTCFKNNGVEYPMQSPEIRQKAEATNLKNLGVKHSLQSPEIKEKIKETNLKKFGVENPIQSPEIIAKIKETNLDRYGFENPFQSKEIKEKIKETNLKKYGVENPSQSSEIKEKKIDTCLKNHGCEHPTQSPEIIAKAKETNLDRYGFEHPTQSLKVRKKTEETNLKIRGVKYPMQSKEVMRKSIVSAYKSKEYNFNNNNNKVYIQGYENLALEKLEKNYGYTYQDFKLWDNNDRIPYKLNGIIHYYFPDIPFLRNNLIIEVKSVWTMYKDIKKNIKKAFCVLNKNINFQFWIYDNKKELIILDGKLIKIKNDINREIQLINQIPN